MVRVPVLSVQSTSIAPRFWIADIFLTIVFFFARNLAPFASVPFTIIGSIPGVIPTATEIENRKASSQFFFTRPLIRSTNKTTITM